MTTVELELYDAVKEKIGEKESKLLLQTIETKVASDLDKIKETLATKEDMANLKDDIANFKVDVKEDIANLKDDLANFKADVKEDIANFKADVKEDIANLKADIAHVKADLIKWMFIFWAGMLGSLVGILKLVGAF